MMERLLLLSNHIVLGIFIHDKEVNNDPASSFEEAKVSSTSVLLILISSNGRYLRIYDNNRLVPPEHIWKNKTNAKLYDYNYYHHHLTEYCPRAYVSYVTKLLRFRNSSVYHSTAIFWSKRLLSSDTKAVSSEDILKFLKTAEESVLTHWTLTMIPSEFSTAKKKHVSFLSHLNESSWLVIATDVLNPDNNYLAVCPFRKLLRLTYTVWIKEDNHQLYDHYLQRHIEEIGKGQSHSKYSCQKKGITPYLPGYYQYIWKTYIPLQNLNSHSTAYDLVQQLYDHFERKKQINPLPINRLMISIQDQSSQFSQEMKELQEISPYLNPLFASLSPSFVPNEDTDTTSTSPTSRIRDPRNREYRYPIFSTLPLFVTKERVDGYDFTYTAPKNYQRANQQSEKEHEILQSWIITLVDRLTASSPSSSSSSSSLPKMASSEDRTTNDKSDLLLSAIPVSLFEDSYYHRNSSDDSSSILFLQNEFFQKFSYEEVIPQDLQQLQQSQYKIQTYTLHINSLPHLILTNLDEQDKPKCLSQPISLLSRFTQHYIILQRLVYLQRYFLELLPVIQPYYEQYQQQQSDRSQRMNLPSSNIFTTRLIMNEISSESLSPANVSPSTTEDEQYMTEEYHDNTGSFTVIVAGSYDHPKDHPTCRKIVKVLANYSNEHLILHYYVQKKNFMALLPNLSEIFFTEDNYFDHTGIFQIIHHYQTHPPLSTSRLTLFEQHLLLVLPKVEQLLRFTRWITYSPESRQQLLQHQQQVLQQAQQLQYQHKIYQELQSIRQYYDQLTIRQRRKQKKQLQLEELFTSTDDTDEWSKTSGLLDESLLEDDEEVEEDSDYHSYDDDDKLESEIRESTDREEDSWRVKVNPVTIEDGMSILDQTYLSSYQSPFATKMSHNEGTPMLDYQIQTHSRRVNNSVLSATEQMDQIQEQYLQTKATEKFHQTSLQHYLLHTVRETIQANEMLFHKNQLYLQENQDRILRLCQEEEEEEVGREG